MDKKIDCQSAARKERFWNERERERERERETDRQTDRQTERKTDTERTILFHFYHKSYGL